MIARVRLVIRLSIAETSMFQVAASQSTRTGIAPSRDTAAAQEMIVNVGMMTSSPKPRSSAAQAASRAADPLQTATPCLRPTRSANLDSKSRMNGPSEDIQPVSMHWLRYFRSLPSSTGSLTGMKAVKGLFRTYPYKIHRHQRRPHTSGANSNTSYTSSDEAPRKEATRFARASKASRSARVQRNTAPL